MQRFERAGFTTAYAVDGAGRPVLLIHGVGARLDTWDGVVAALDGPLSASSAIGCTVSPGLSLRISATAAAGGDVDAVPVDRRVVGDDIAEVDADAKAHASMLGHALIARGHHGLDLDRAFSGTDDAGNHPSLHLAGRGDGFDVA
jgi:hypothetical protein